MWREGFQGASPIGIHSGTISFFTARDGTFVCTFIWSWPYPICFRAFHLRPTTAFPSGRIILFNAPLLTVFVSYIVQYTYTTHAMERSISPPRVSRRGTGTTRYEKEIAGAPKLADDPNERKWVGPWLMGETIGKGASGASNTVASYRVIVAGV